MKHRLRDRSQRQQKKQIIEDDPYKLSIHTSSNFNKSDSGSKRLNISRMLQNSRKKISMRKASQLFQSGSIRPQSSKVAKRNEVIEFDNIKWISIISAYDPSRLKNVSVSKKSCQKFLSTQGQNIKTDSRNLLYFNDLIKNFKSWLNKIQMQYCYIMNKFLHQRGSVNITLTQLRPKLDQVINQTVHMQQNLQDCLKSYENHQFRQLLKKYHSYLEKSKQFEDMILSVNKSKNKIVDLYKKFDDDKKIEQKITKVKNEGINEVKMIVSDNQVQLQTKIMDRIQLAINQMAQKSGQAYRKIKGVKHLIDKFKKTQNQSQDMNKIDIEAINLMGKVCKEICYQAQAFEEFSARFLVDGGIINEDLQKIIKKYQEEVTNERKKAIDLQMKFLNIIFSETIKKLKDNCKIAAVYQKADINYQEYKKILRMIQDIADCIIDPGQRIALQKLIKETRAVFDRLYDQLKYLKENKKFEQIDTEEGLISILEISKLIKDYKDKILLVRKKFEYAHRDAQLSPIKIEPIMNDQQTQFINLIIALSKKINNSGLKNKISQQSCFTSITKQLGLLKMNEQLEKEKILEQVTSISNQFLQLQSRNVLQKYFGQLKLQNLIFKESIVMVELKKCVLKTQEKNIIPQLNQLLAKRNSWIEKHKKISPQMKRFFERILATAFVKGLKPEDIKQIQDPQSMIFPTKQNHIQSLKTKAKYRQVLFDLIQKSASQNTKQLILENSGIKSQQKNKNHRVLKSAKIRHSFFVSDILEKSIFTINNFISSFMKISEIKQNINGQSYIMMEYLLEFSYKLFTETFLKKQNEQAIKNLLREIAQISYDKFLNLTRRIIVQEGQWKQNERKVKSENQINFNKNPIYVQRIIQILQYYKVKAQTLSDLAKNNIEQLHKELQKLQNSQEQIEDYRKLNVYTKMMSSLVKYCKDTDQKVHVILDTNKSPIVLINPNKNVLKQVFPGMKKGKELSINQIQKLIINEAKVGIELKMKKKKILSQHQNQTKNDKKLKKKQSDMDEQILDENDGDDANELEEQYPADDVQEIEQNDIEIPDDDMTEQLGQEVIEQPDEQMIEDFEAPQQVQDDIQEQKFDDEALQDLIEQSQNLGKSKGKAVKQKQGIKSKTNKSIDDYGQFNIQDKDDKAGKLSKKDKREIDQKKQKQKQEQQRKERQFKELQEMNKKQVKQLQQKNIMKQQTNFQAQPERIIIKENIYEILGFITSLYQLKKLIAYLNSFEQNYFKSFIDWQKVQDYFNNHNASGSDQESKQVQKYMKNLQNDVQVKLKKQFQSHVLVFNEIKNLDQIKKLKKDLVLLKNGNWQALQQILTNNHVSYNILKGENSTFYVWIKMRDQQFDEFGCIDGYLKKNFKHYQIQKFDLKGFAQKCFAIQRIESIEHSHTIISYHVKSETTLIENSSQIEQTFQKLCQVIRNFTNGAKDIVNKFDFCLQLYKKVLQIKQKIDLDLNWYSAQIKFLQKFGTDESHPLSYMHFVKENIKTVIKKVKSLQSKLYNLSFKCEKSNILECFDQLEELYGEQIHRKVSLKKGQAQRTILVFDKSTITQNEEKIKRILSSKPKNQQEQVEKILLSVIFSSQDQKLAQVDEGKIVENTKNMDTKDSELLLRIIQTLRIDHSYVLIKEKGLEFFVLRRLKEQCIGSFVSKVVGMIVDSKQAKDALDSSSLFEGLKQSVKSQEIQSYKKLFSNLNLQLLFKEKIINQRLYQQIEVVVDPEMFMVNANWLDQTIKVMKDIVEVSKSKKGQTQKIIRNLKKLNPCRQIYYKRFVRQKQSQISVQWKEHLRNYESILSKAKNIMSKKSWILLTSQIEQKLKIQLTRSLSMNIDVIKSLIRSQGIENSLKEIIKQVKKVFEWIQQIDGQQGKVQLAVMTLPKQGQIVYFECYADGFKEDMMMERLAFIEPQKVELRQVLSKHLFGSLRLNKDEGARSLLKLRKSDKIYEIDTQAVQVAVTNWVKQNLGEENHFKRDKTVRELVRVFNRIYFLSKTTAELNFQHEKSSLENLQKDFQSSLQQLRLVYQFRDFLHQYCPSFWKGYLMPQSLKQQIDKEMENEKIPQEQIGQILQKLSKIKTNTRKSSIDSYKPFYSWFYHTVMSLLKLPFYNIITHIQNSTKKQETQFIGVIVTQKLSKPGEQNEELQRYMKEVLLFTEHKPIYLRQNDMTVELTKEPVYVELDGVINGIELSEIVSYLNENSEETARQKVLSLRVDEVLRSEMQDHQERNLLKMIPLTEFLKNREQQFNIHISQENLTVEIEFNIVSVQANSQNLSKESSQSQIPLNGSSVDSFEKVYIGRRLKLQKLKSWLHSYYLKTKNLIQVQNKQKEIQDFFDGFVQYFMAAVPSDNQESVRKVISSITLDSLYKDLNTKIQTKPLYLQSSHDMIEDCKKNLEKYKIQQYQQKSSLQKHYDKDVLQLIKNFQIKLYEQLIKIETQIKTQLEQKTKLMAKEKVQEILLSVQKRKQQDRLEKQKKERQKQQQKEIQKEKEKQKQKEKQRVKEAQKIQQRGRQQLNQQIGQVQNVGQIQSKKSSSEQISEKQQQNDKNQQQIKKEKEQKELNELRKSDFGLYLAKRVEINFGQFTQQVMGKLREQIVEKMRQKLELIEKGSSEQIIARLVKKVDMIYPEKELINQMDVNLHLRLFFFYFVMEKNQYSHIKLFIGEN